MSTCFAPLLGWVLRLWQSEERRLPLVMDATSLGNRWTILAISVVLRGCAIPVAWKVLPAEQAGSWRPYWEGLLNELGKAVPPEWEVIVLADRECGVESTRAWRGKLCVDQSLGAHAGNELAGQSGMLCQQKGAGEWNLAAALGSRI